MFCLIRGWHSDSNDSCPLAVMLRGTSTRRLYVTRVGTEHGNTPALPHQLWDREEEEGGEGVILIPDFVFSSPLLLSNPLPPLKPSPAAVLTHNPASLVGITQAATAMPVLLEQPLMPSRAAEDYARPPLPKNSTTSNFLYVWYPVILVNLCSSSKASPSLNSLSALFWKRRRRRKKKTRKRKIASVQIYSIDK